jgi:hypothetical protein
VLGAIEMGAGDDTVKVGDNAVVPNTILGGETQETVGDSLYIGSTNVCSEDGQAVADAGATGSSISALDPNGGTVTYMGQTYTWAEFEHIASGLSVSPCFGRISDGRINAYDLAASNALYCAVEGGVIVWNIDLQGNGTFGYYATTEQIDAAFAQAVASQTNTLVQTDSLNSPLYALSDGHTLAFFSKDLREPGKTYQFTFERGLCS